MPRVAPFNAASAGGWPPTQISVRCVALAGGERLERFGDGARSCASFSKSARIIAPRASGVTIVPTYIGYERMRSRRIFSDAASPGTSAGTSPSTRTASPSAATAFTCGAVSESTLDGTTPGILADAVGEAADPRERVRVHHVAVAHADRDDRGLVRAEPLPRRSSISVYGCPAGTSSERRTSRRRWRSSCASTSDEQRRRPPPPSADVS